MSRYLYIRNTVNKVNGQMIVWEKIFATSKTETRLIFRICYELPEIIMIRKHSRKISSSPKRKSKWLAYCCRSGFSGRQTRK